MSSQFDKSYRVTSSSTLDHHLWNGVFRNIDQRLIGIEDKKASFEEAERQLLEIGLSRINNTLTPAALKIARLSELGFLVASSQELLKPIEGQDLSVHLVAGEQAELFHPSPFIALVRRSTPDIYAIGQLLHHDRELLRIDIHIVATKGVNDAYSDWDICALAGSVKAMWDALQESRSICDEVNQKHGEVNTKAADIATKHSDIYEKHNDFTTTWYGARSNAPPNSAQIGSMYLASHQNPPTVKVKTATGWIDAALPSDSIYTKGQADAKFLPIVGGTMGGTINLDSSNALRFVGGSVEAPAVIIHKNSSHFYFFLTDENDRNGAWNNLRPFRMDLSSGKIVMSCGLHVAAGDVTFSSEATFAQATTFGKKIDVFGEIQAKFTNGLRFVGDGYYPSLIMRKDTSNFYLLLTGEGEDKYGNFNNKRPFFINLTTGVVSINEGLKVKGKSPVTDVRLAGDAMLVNGGDLPAGYVMVGGGGLIVHGKQIQIYIPETGWRAVASA